MGRSSVYDRNGEEELGEKRKMDKEEKNKEVAERGGARTKANKKVEKDKEKNDEGDDK